MREHWLFRKTPNGLPAQRRGAFWRWNGVWLLLSGLGLGVLSLLYAYGDYPDRLLKSYFSHPLIALLNLLPVLTALLLVYALVGRPWLAFLLTGVVVWGLSLGNYYKLRFRDDPVMFQDLKYLREAGAITTGADYDLTPDLRVWFGLACLVGGTLFLLFLVRGRPGRRARLALLLIGALACVPVAWACGSETLYDTATANYDDINQWSSTQVYLSKGFLYPFLHSVTADSLKAPDGYSESDTAALLASYTDADIPADRQVDLITLQLEAFSDFSLFDGVEGVDFDAAYGVYHDLEAESYAGNLITNIFAGGTVDTERAFLTGYADQWNYRGSTNSYAWYFASQGYTVEGSHPCYEWFYNRRNVNTYLGLSTYYFYENLYGTMVEGESIAADDLLLPKIFDLYAENRDGSGAPYFSFNVSYQGHGPYSTESVWRGKHYTDGRYSTETTNILDNYLGSVSDTAEQLQTLVDRLRQEERPVVLVVFGDHKPWLGDGNSAYHELGVDLDTSTEEGFYNYYSTRYLIWANDAAKAALGNDFVGEGPDVSSCFLMNLLFDQCGWTGDAWAQATTDIWRRLPILTSVGQYVENGVLTETPDETVLDAYHSLEYYAGTHFRYG